MKDERAKMKIASKREQRELVHYAEREQLKACVAGLKLRVSESRSGSEFKEFNEFSAFGHHPKFPKLPKLPNFPKLPYAFACRVAVALLPFFAFFTIFAPLNIY